MRGAAHAWLSRLVAVCVAIGVAAGLVALAGPLSTANAALPAATSPAAASPALGAAGVWSVRSSSMAAVPRVASSYDKKLLRLINKARAANGVPALKTTKKLRKAAGKWSKKLAAKRKLSHDPNLRASVSSKAGCSNVMSWGENVAYTSGSASSMFAMYMNSPGHRANILERGYTHVGVTTVKRKASWGNVHWNTMKFVTARCS